MMVATRALLSQVMPGGMTMAGREGVFRFRLLFPPAGVIGAVTRRSSGMAGTETVARVIPARVAGARETA
jgi:hypothetical protein